MLEGIVQSLAMVAAMTISLDGEVVGEAKTMEEQAPHTVVVRDLAVSREGLARWLNGGGASGELELVAKDRRGEQLFVLDLDQLRVRSYAHDPRQGGDRTRYSKLVIIDAAAIKQEEEQDD